MQEVTILDLRQTKGRILGVDFGDTRTGLAVSDASRFLASGIGYVSPGGIVKTADKVAEVAREQKVSAIVVGLPKNMDGSEGFRADRCREFADLLRERLEDIPVAMMDERMTTMSASRYLNETNTRGQKRKGVIDTLSAQILEFGKSFRILRKRRKIYATFTAAAHCRNTRFFLRGEMRTDRCDPNPFGDGISDDSASHGTPFQPYGWL